MNVRRVIRTPGTIADDGSSSGMRRFLVEGGLSRATPSSARGDERARAVRTAASHEADMARKATKAKSEDR